MRLPSFVGLVSTVVFPLAASAGTGFPAGHVLVNDPDDGQIIEFTPDGVLVREFGTDDKLASAQDMVIGPDGRLYVASYSPSSIMVLDETGDEVDEWTDPALTGGRGLAVGPNGEIYASSFFGDKVAVFSASGSLTRTLGPGTTLTDPVGLAFGPTGNLYVANIAGNKVHELDIDGGEVRVIGAAAAPDATYVAVGPEGLLYVGCYASHSIMRFDASGSKVGELVLPVSGVNDIAFGPEGDLYLSDGFGLSTFGTLGSVTTPLGGFNGTGHAVGFAVVPHRFKATITGKLTRDDGTKVTIKQKAILSIQPGSTQAMVELAIPAEIDLDSLPYALGTPFLVFTGSETVASDNAKSRRFQGLEILAKGLESGSGAATLEIAGKIVDGRFVPTETRGTIQRGNGKVHFAGRIETTKLLN